MFNAKTGTSNNLSNHRYWRLVTGVNNDAYTDDAGNHYGYIDLSACDCETDSDVPQAGDVINQLGCRGDKTRQAAMILDTVGPDAPSIKMLTGINHYTLVDKDIISQGYDHTKGRAYFRCYGDTLIGNPDGSFIKYELDKFLLNNVSAEVKGPDGIMSGLNGKYDAALGGKTIAVWWGGEMIDLFNPDDTRVTPVPLGAATALVRLDGSGYFSNGALWWDKDGNLFLGSGVRIEGADGKTLAGIVNFLGNIDRLLVPVNAAGEELDWTDAAGAVALKAKVDLFSTGNVAAFGLEDAGDDPGNTGGGGGSCDCEGIPVDELRAAVIAILEGYGGAWEPGGVLPPPTCDCEELSELEVGEVINKNFK